MKRLDKIKNYSVVLFNSAIFAAMVQGAAVSIFAFMQKRPPAPHRYYDAVSGFDFYYFFSFFKHLFYLASVAMALIFISQVSLREDEEERATLARFLKTFPLILAGIYTPMLIVTSQSSGGWLMLFAGLKAMIPFMAIAIGFIFNKGDLKNLSKFIDLLLLAHLLFAVFQKIFVYNYCGYNTYGCEQIRMTGMFMEPNTLGGVVLIKLLLSSINEEKLNNSWIFIICAILLLAQSKASLIIFAVCLFFIELKSKFWILALFLFSILSFSYLLSRTGFDSMHERILFLTSNIDSNIWFGHGFGYGTQAHTLLRNFNYNVPVPPILDSQFSSIIYQGGIWFLFVLIALSLWLLRSIKLNFIKLTAIIFWLSSGTIVIMEMWPLNIIMFMTIGYALKRHFSSSDNTF